LVGAGDELEVVYVVELGMRISICVFHRMVRGMVGLLH
jgi:hypothetical protein